MSQELNQSPQAAEMIEVDVKSDTDPVWLLRRIEGWMDDRRFPHEEMAIMGNYDKIRFTCQRGHYELLRTALEQGEIPAIGNARASEVVPQKNGGRSATDYVTPRIPGAGTRIP